MFTLAVTFVAVILILKEYTIIFSFHSYHRRLEIKVRSRQRPISKIIWFNSSTYEILLDISDWSFTDTSSVRPHPLLLHGEMVLMIHFALDYPTEIFSSSRDICLVL